MAITCMVLFGLGFGLYDANNMPILSQIVGPRYRATGYGIMNSVSIAVAGRATVALGAMRDHGVSLSLAFTILAVVTAIGGALIFLVRPRQS